MCEVLLPLTCSAELKVELLAQVLIILSVLFCLVSLQTAHSKNLPEHLRHTQVNIFIISIFLFFLS